MEARHEDSVVRSGRREALWSLALFAAALSYTVPYCYIYGYHRPVDSAKFVLWFPDWVFWGIVVPWLACVIASTYFAFRIMGDEPLGEEEETRDDRSMISEVDSG